MSKRRRTIRSKQYAFGGLDESTTYSHDLSALNAWAQVHLPYLKFVSEVPDGHCYYYAIARQMHPNHDAEEEPATWAKQQVLLPMFRANARRIFLQNKPEPTTVSEWSDLVQDYIKQFVVYEEDDSGRRTYDWSNAPFDKSYLRIFQNAAKRTVQGSVEDFFDDAAKQIYKERTKTSGKLFPFVNMLDIELMQQNCERPILTFSIVNDEVRISYVDRGTQGTDIETAKTIVQQRNPIVLAHLRANGETIAEHYGSGLIDTDRLQEFQNANGAVADTASQPPSKSSDKIDIDVIDLVDSSDDEVPSKSKMAFLSQNGEYSWLLKQIKQELNELPYKQTIDLSDASLRELTRPCAVCDNVTQPCYLGRKNVALVRWADGLVDGNVFPVCARCWNIRAGLSPDLLREQCMRIHKFMTDPTRSKVMAIARPLHHRQRQLAQRRDMKRRELAHCNLISTKLPQFDGLPCYYCGDRSRQGVDRIDSNRCPGYTYSNTVPCCTLCNKMKHVLPKSLFLDAVRNVAQSTLQNQSTQAVVTARKNKQQQMYQLRSKQHANCDPAQCKGTCVNNRCKCRTLWTGPNCDKLKPFSRDHNKEISTYFRYKVHNTGIPDRLSRYLCGLSASQRELIYQIANFGVHVFYANLDVKQKHHVTGFTRELMSEMNYLNDSLDKVSLQDVAILAMSFLQQSVC